MLYWIRIKASNKYIAFNSDVAILVNARILAWKIYVSIILGPVLVSESNIITRVSHITWTKPKGMELLVIPRQSLI
jgi:hypothetical protein